MTNKEACNAAKNLYLLGDRSFANRIENAIRDGIANVADFVADMEAQSEKILDVLETSDTIVLLPDGRYYGADPKTGKFRYTNNPFDLIEI